MEKSNQLPPSPSVPFTCFLIGQDRLLHECASLIQQRHGRILGVISPSIQVRDWAQSQAIPWFFALGDVDWPTQSADYLFSIVNNEMILPAVRSRIGRLAINYHDGPLPRYAGSNATFWAILNGEARHAVSWHAISEQVDAGDLLKQRFFDLQPDETVLSLNLKCIEHAMASFAEMLDEILTGRLQRSPQNLALRSYFLRAQKPPDNGWINWHTDAEQLLRLIRATQFGRYRNPVTVPKILVNDTVLVVGALNELPELSDQLPGTLLEIRQDYWVIATQTRNVKITALNAPREKPWEDLEALAHQYQLARGICLPSPQPGQGELLQQFSQRMFCDEAYWIDRLEKFPATPVASPLANVDLTRLPAPLFERLKNDDNHSQEASLAVLSAWLIYLRRCIEQTQLAVSVAWETPDLPPGIAPFFARHLPFTVSIDDTQGFDETLKRVRLEYEQIGQHGTYLIDCWQRYPELAEHRTQGLGCQIRVGALMAQEEGSESSLPQPFLTLLESLLAQPQQPTAQATWITPAERQQLLIDWNQTETPYPDHQTIHGLFEEQVQKTPDNLALVAPGVRLSYRELNQHANQLAHYLLKVYAITPDQLVAVCLERSQWLLVALLGILKSGAGYVPIDPAYPDKRIRFVVEQTKACTIITTGNFAQRLLNLGAADQHSQSVVVLDELVLRPLWQQQSKDNPVTAVGSRHLAYVMYTSGTTGTPKGIQIEHRSIVNRLFWMDRTYPLTSGDRVLQKTPMVFDVSVWELFWAHWTGAAIVFAKPDGHRNLEYLAKIISDEAISIVHFTPTMLSGFVQAIESEAHASPPVQDQFHQLRYLFCSGEVLHDTTFARAQALLPHARIVNLYGPTEAAIDVLYYECLTNRPVCLGKPIANTRVYVLDDQQQPLPVGQAGQLYLAGDGLARGYLNQPALTAQQFISNPLLSKAEKKRARFDRLYKTGDLVRWLPGGEIDYIGRLDRQIKLRGNRIELDEIEQVILRYPSVRQCAVIVDDKHLVACYTATGTIDEADLQQHVKGWLPEYMIPHQWICIEQLPTGISGKVDYKVLVRPAELKSDNIAPTGNTIETTMVMVFAAVLGLEPSGISTTDDFFKLGGDSILAIRLVSRINELLDQHIQVRQVFELKTIHALSEFIEQTAPTISMPETPYEPFSLIDTSHYQDLLSHYDIEDIYPASHLQIGMLLESSLNSSGTYHDVFFYEINCRFVEDQFLKTWEALANKHALLRARFFLSEQHALDVAIFRKAQLYFRFYFDHDLQTLIDTERLVHFSHSEECLFHLLVNAHSESFELIFSFHHAIVDGWSVASLINEFIQAYACHLPITSTPANQSRLSYGEFVRNERSRMNDQQSISFWKNYLEEANPAQANWKFDDRATSPDSLFASAFYLTPEQAKQTLQLARYTGVNPDTIFLYAYLKTLSFFLNSDDLTIGVVFNNRLEKTGGDTLFGVFLNVLPFRQKLDHNKGIQAALSETFANRIKILAHRHIPYARLKSLLRRDLYKFGYNFINFHVLNQSQAWIKRRGGFDRTSIPFFLEVTQNETFKVEIKSHDNYISQDYLHYFLQYFKVSLQNILDGQNKLSLCAQDYQKMILDWNATERPYPREKTVHRLFEEQVVKTPDAIALVSQKTKLTYQELNQRANRLASYLLTRYQIDPDDLIALFLDRNEWMVISILAVLKSGAAYVPIETAYPEERIKYIVSETEAKVVLTNVRHKIALKDQKLGSILFCVDGENDENYSPGESELNPLSSVTSTNLAYVIYTSGTTGLPNGVMIEHRSVVNTLHALYPVYQCPKNRRATAYTSYVFDVSVAEIFTVLTSGAELHLLDKERRDISQLADYLLRHEINIAYLPPAILSILAKLHYPALEVLIFAGEPCPESVAQFWAMNHALYNYYGPTEFTIYATGGRVGDNINNIGMPISNNQVYVLSQDRVPVPFGAIGELHLSGDGAARGYFKNKKLTDEKFIAHKFDGAGRLEHKKLYKTGDLVRWLPSGELEFIGRNDSQVKINGYRIELGEIEHVLNKYPGMKHSAVMVHEHRNELPNSRANKYLVGYYLLDSEFQDEDQHNHLDNWKQLYESEYADLNLLDYKENTSGWKSSYTGESFSKEEMQEWREEIVEKISQLKPKRIVEIGSGTGMLLFSLIDHCDYYFASDLSDSAIQYIRQASHRLGYQDKLMLFTGDAKKIPFFKLDKKFDTAILNSVIQYFPTVTYLDEVLNKLIENIEVPGQIFIGDVRDLRLLHCFKCSVLTAKCSPIRRRQEIDYFVSCEKELLIDPGYFLNFQKNDSRIRHVELLPKRGIFSNEMNHYRYDVVLHIGDESVPTFEIELSQTEDFKKLPDILDQPTGDAFAFRYPNKQILTDYKEYSRIYELPFDFNDQQIDELLTPNEIRTMLRRYGYDTQLNLDLNCPYGLAIAAYKSKKFHDHRIQLHAVGAASSTSELTNNQILNARLMHDRNGIAIKNYLKSLLPDYMVPNYLFPLNKLSITASGKLDRSALPIPEISITEIIAPRTKMEIDISQIFSEVLGLPLSKIGVKNSFVDMGGNSLSAIVLVSKLNRHFSVELKIGDIVKHKSVEGLGQLLIGLKDVKSR